MSQPTPLLQRRWPWWLAGAAVLIALLSSMVRIPRIGDWDTRPQGSPEDIAALREADDVNVLFILIDTLRAERLGAWGYERDTSPVLDRIASRGVRFEHTLSQSSWTKASMASIWTGLLPNRAGITRFDHVLPDDAVMPAEVLRDAGFKTVGLYRNGWVAPTFGFSQGFDIYKKPSRKGLPPNVRRDNPTLSDNTTDESVASAAIEFLRLQGHERWFLYLHLMDLHEYLFDEESALFGSSYSDNYDNSIRWTDGVIELLFASLSELGLLENTLVVIASDHGEAFRERGIEGHARRVYRETTDVPWILSLPFRLEPGATVTARTANVDIWPTIFDLLGLQGGQSDGRSRRPEILAASRGEDPPESDGYLVTHLDQHWARPNTEALPTVALIDGSKRFVRIDHKIGDRVEQLFDASEDPKELRDEGLDDPEALEPYRAAADAYLELEPDWGAPPTRDLSELELNHLRALGYVIE